MMYVIDMFFLYEILDILYQQLYNMLLSNFLFVNPDYVLIIIGDLIIKWYRWFFFIYACNC